MCRQSHSYDVIIMSWFSPSYSGSGTQTLDHQTVLPQVPSILLFSIPFHSTYPSFFPPCLPPCFPSLSLTFVLHSLYTYNVLRVVHKMNDLQLRNSERDSYTYHFNGCHKRECRDTGPFLCPLSTHMHAHMCTNGAIIGLPSFLSSIPSHGLLSEL